MAVARQKLKRYKFTGKPSHRKAFGTAAIQPPTLGRKAKYIKDQGYTSYCTAAARSSAGSYLYGREMSFEYQTAKEGQVAGFPISNGTSPEIADDASTKYGFLPDEQSPFKFSLNGWDKPADWRLYPSALDGQTTSFTPSKPYNVYPDYDSIKNALIQANDDDGVVIANGFWWATWNNAVGILPVPTGNPSTRHDYLFIDYETQSDGVERLVLQLSQGTEFGVGGILYASREVIDAAWKYPAYNGIGCEVFRVGNGMPTQNQLASFKEQLIALLGLIRDYLLFRP